MMWFEVITKRLMLGIGVLGVVVIYFGFFYLLLTQSSVGVLSWYILLSPWLCIYFGLSNQQQHDTLAWLRKRLFFWRK